jgi:hypothetical protein
MEDKIYINRKEYYLQKLKMNTTIWIKKRKKLKLLENSNIIDGFVGPWKVKILKCKLKEELSRFIYKPKNNKIENYC